MAEKKVVKEGKAKKIADPVASSIDPIKHARKMIAHIDKKRQALGIDRARERILVDMADRRDLESA